MSHKLESLPNVAKIILNEFVYLFHEKVPHDLTP